jgi:hypothetical protein
MQLVFLQFLFAVYFLTIVILVSCNNLLNSGNVNEHEKKIYCIGCYRRQFGPHGGEYFTFVLHCTNAIF